MSTSDEFVIKESSNLIYCTNPKLKKKRIHVRGESSGGLGQELSEEKDRGMEMISLNYSILETHLIIIYFDQMKMYPFLLLHPIHFRTLGRREGGRREGRK